MYTEDSIEEVKASANIVEVAEEFVTLKQRGKNFTACCPIHQEKTPSFHLNTVKNSFKCYGCGKGGDPLQLIQEMLNLSYPDALRHLATKNNIELINEGSQIYAKPTFNNKTDISTNIVKWFAKRKIGQTPLTKLKITEGAQSMPFEGGWKDMNCIHFNYFREDELVNTKLRGENKAFMLVKNAELIFYNLDSLKGKKEVIIVEGEMDVLALYEAGMDSNYAILSVPNGASKHRNNLIYVNNCIKAFDDIEKVHFGLDCDSNGRKLMEELSERFGKDKCDHIEWKDQKDANDVLIHYGIQGIIECVSKPINFQLEGAFTVSDFSYEIDDMYANGLERGVSLGIKDFHLRIVPGYITIVTGISGHGKSEGVDEFCLRLTTKHGWPGAFYSPENKPTQLHYSKMARRLVGKAWDGDDRMTKEEEQQAREYLEKKVWFIKPEKDFSLDSVLKSIKNLKKDYGIKYFVIDAWNKLTHKSNDVAEIEKALNDLALFCEAELLHCFLVAHAVKPEVDKKTGKVKVPQLWNISGSNNFHNKADNGVCIYLDRETKVATFHVLKVKFNHWGWNCSPEFDYDKDSGRYFKKGFPDNVNWITQKRNIKPVKPGEINFEEGNESVGVLEPDGDDKPF